MDDTVSSWQGTLTMSRDYSHNAQFSFFSAIENCHFRNLWEHIDWRVMVMGCLSWSQRFCNQFVTHMFAVLAVSGLI